MLKLDINHALYFLDQLDPNARHTIASEAPFGKNGLPKWEIGCTYEASQRDLLIRDIHERQDRGSNIYYSVNRPCKVIHRQGVYGKNNVDDIIAIRALAFDIDVLAPHETVLDAIDKNLDNELKPSIIIFTGGGYHLIYLLNKIENIKLFRPPKNDEEEQINNKIIENRMIVTALARDFEHLLRSKFNGWKIDSMSNVDRVMRLPGTVNYPKLEKQEKGQKPALSQILVENYQKVDIRKLRSQIESLSSIQPATHAKRPFKPSKKTDWTGYLKAKECCEYIRKNGLADNNEIYAHNVMFPLIGAIHDTNEYSKITLAEAEELFMLAISGGTRYGVNGRGPRYFMRQWRSHHPELPRIGTKKLGGLIYFAQEHGFQLPWKGIETLDEDTKKQLAEISGTEQIISDDLVQELSQD
jgi:hypothetical protein